jgi:membrane protein implicated in regulation of membrane protease activity
MSPFGRYLLLQIPGWLAVTAAMAALHWFTAWPLWIVPVGLAVFVAKDVAMYRVYRDTLRPPTGLVGSRGRAIERLDPRGYVRIEGELWRAHADGPPIAAGTEVIVHKTQGLTLHVTATPR